MKKRRGEKKRRSAQGERERRKVGKKEQKKKGRETGRREERRREDSWWGEPRDRDLFISGRAQAHSGSSSASPYHPVNLFLPVLPSFSLSLSLSLLRRSLLSPSSCSSTCANSAASSTPFVASFRSMFYSTAKLILMSERGVARWQPLAHLYRVVRFQQTASETRYICVYRFLLNLLSEECNTSI